ncbi:unnamed protein product [Leuciscus chuanchicus]
MALWQTELGNPFKRDSEVKFYIILSTGKISLDTKEVEINLQLETTSSQEGLTKVKAKAKVVIELLLSVQECCRSSTSILPASTKMGSFLQLLYSTKLTSDPDSNITHLRSTSTRRKRELEERRPSDGSKVSLFTDKRKHKILSCSGDARCVEMKCPLQGLDSTAVIVLKSRLWNSTFLEDYASYNYLDIIVKASISLDVSANNIVLKNAETQVRLTVFPETTATPFGGVPWWIILVAVLAGILMLALLVLLLWKCGFFKRAKKDEYDAAIHKAEIHTQPSDKLSTEA